MKGRTILKKHSDVENEEFDYFEKRNARDKRTADGKHQMKAATRKTRYENKHIDIDGEIEKENE